jgi:hypothetical protein
MRIADAEIFPSPAGTKRMLKAPVASVVLVNKPKTDTVAPANGVVAGIHCPAQDGSSWVGHQRIEAEFHFETVGNAITVGIGIADISTKTIFVEVREAVAVKILAGIDRIIRVEPPGDFGVVRDAVAVGVDGREDLQGQKGGGAVLYSGDDCSAGSGR